MPLTSVLVAKLISVRHYKLIRAETEKPAVVQKYIFPNELIGTDLTGYFYTYKGEHFLRHEKGKLP
jgi:hypothetical protein